MLIMGLSVWMYVKELGSIQKPALQHRLLPIYEKPPEPVLRAQEMSPVCRVGHAACQLPPSSSPNGSSRSDHGPFPPLEFYPRFAIHQALPGFHWQTSQTRLLSHARCGVVLLECRCLPLASWYAVPEWDQTTGIVADSSQGSGRTKLRLRMSPSVVR